MLFNVLGPLEIRHNGQVYTPTAQKVRWTLGLLLLRANQIVDRASLIDEIWGDSPPRSAVTTMQTYIYQLRKSFNQIRGGAYADQMILTQPPGYGIRLLEGDQLDLHLFEHDARRGRELAAQGRHQEASQLFVSALKLWRGTPLADISKAGRLIEAHTVYLEELRLKTLKLRILTESQLGRDIELIPELRELVSAYPLNEWFHGQLIKSLARADRRGEALKAYQSLRQTLLDELGLEPSTAYRTLQRQLLSDDWERSLRTPQPVEGGV